MNVQVSDCIPINVVEDFINNNSSKERDRFGWRAACFPSRVLVNMDGSRMFSNMDILLLCNKTDDKFQYRFLVSMN